MKPDEITAILAECRAHWAEHGANVPDAALKALEDVLQGLDAAPRLDFITTAGHDAARIFAELQAHRSRGMTAATLQAEADRLAAKWANYFAWIEGQYLAEERTYRVTIERDAEGNETTTTPPNPYAELLGITRLSTAAKTAAAQAAAGQQDVLPTEQQQPEQRTPPREQIVHDREGVTAAVKFVLSELGLLNTAGKFTGSNRDGTAKALFHVLRTKTYWDAGAGQDKEFAAYWKEQFNGGISVKALGDKHTQSFGADYAKVMALIEKYERENAP